MLPALQAVFQTGNVQAAQSLPPNFVLWHDNGTPTLTAPAWAKFRELAHKDMTARLRQHSGGNS